VEGLASLNSVDVYDSNDDRDQVNAGSKDAEEPKGLSSGHEADGDETDGNEAKLKQFDLQSLEEDAQYLSAAANTRQGKNQTLTWQLIRDRKQRRAKVQQVAESDDESQRRTSRNSMSRKRRRRIQKEKDALDVEKQPSISTLHSVNFVSAPTVQDTTHTLYRGLPHRKVRKARRKKNHFECDSDSAEDSQREFLSSSVIVQSWARGRGFAYPSSR